METIEYVLRRSQSWLDKYRPEKLKDVQYQDDVVRLISNMLDQNASWPNMIFYGPCGTGKTTTALAAARQLLGSEQYNSRVVKVSAGNNSVRVFGDVEAAIEKFHRQDAVSGQHQALRGYHHPARPYNIIIVDEASYLNDDGQKALECMISTCSNNTRFILLGDHFTRSGVGLTSNVFYPPLHFDKIHIDHVQLDDALCFIKSLASRCNAFSFNPLPRDFVRCRLSYICGKENLLLDPEAFSLICQYSHSSLRMAIIYLQRAARSFRKSISSKDVLGATMSISRDWADETRYRAQNFLDSCRLDLFYFTKMNIDSIYHNDYDISMFLSELFDVAVELKSIPDDKRPQVCTRLIEADQELQSLSDGEDVHLLLLHLAFDLKKLLYVGSTDKDTDFDMFACNGV